MTRHERHNNKETTLGFLIIVRNLQIAGATISALSTLSLIIYGAIIWLNRSDLFSGDWWGAVVWCFLAYFVLLLYVWFTFVACEASGKEMFVPDWICAYVFLPSFITGYILFLAGMVVLKSLETSNAPSAYSSLAAVTFMISLYLFTAISETNTKIREKTDPSFRRSVGFS